MSIELLYPKERCYIIVKVSRMQGQVMEKEVNHEWQGYLHYYVHIMMARIRGRLWIRLSENIFLPLTPEVKLKMKIKREGALMY